MIRISLNKPITASRAAVVAFAIGLMSACGGGDSPVVTNEDGALPDPVVQDPSTQDPSTQDPTAPNPDPDADATNATQWTRIGLSTRIKTSVADAYDGFGHSVSLSPRADALAVSSVSGFLRGSRVEVYRTDSNGGWIDPVLVPREAGFASGHFGRTVRFSRQGSRLMIADSSAHGDSYDDAYGYQTGVADGAVLIFDRSESGQWAEVARLQAPNRRASDNFGRGAAISGDGRLVVAGVPGRDFNILPTEPVDFAPIYNSGSVFVFEETDSGVFTQRQQLRAPDPDEEDNFGEVVELSKDGSTLLVLSPGDDSSGSGVLSNTDPLTDSASTDSGVVHIYVRGTDGLFSLQANLKSALIDVNPERATQYDFQLFGRNLTISGDGNTVMVGATYGTYDSGLVFPSPETLFDIPRGEVTVFARSGSQWRVAQVIDAPSAEQYTGLYGNNISFSSGFGADLALTTDGSRLAVGMPGFSEHDAGGSFDAGAVFTYARNADGMYEPLHSARLPRPAIGETFGASLAWSGDGRWLVASAPDEDSGGLGVNPSFDAMPILYESGAVYIFDLN